MYFNSRDAACKTPFGAVPTATEVAFRVFPADGEPITACTLLTYREFADRWEERRMDCAEADGKRSFSCIYPAPAEGELVWYHFRLDWADGGACCFDKTGFCAWDAVQPWQLTVYDARRPTPQWFGQGVTYQIFPDRFFRAKARDAAELFGGRHLHENWDEAPEFRPNDHGEVTNSDFFGGDLAGITQKLDYLADLGVTTLYLNPIFCAASNHRYDTADYTRVDPLLGDEDDFRTLCRTARRRGIRVILDGVFNHTGSDSVYFNQKGTFPGVGACQGENSPYYAWYSFHPFPDDYDAWWGIRTLPAVNELQESYVNFVADGKDAIVRRWLRLGASGWRLDVADELPDELIAKIRRATDEETGGDGFLLGEVWEDGSNKIAYSRRRRYLLGDETHALMNYPFRTAALAYLRGGDAAAFRETMETLRENYPAPAFYSAMNFLSTHDTPRLLTALGLPGDAPWEKEVRAVYRLAPEDRVRGLALERLAAVLQFTFPGTPSVYYGDEAGMEGLEDPFNRGTFPWGREDRSLTAFYARLGALRRAHEALRCGTIDYLAADGALLAFSRRTETETVYTVLNAGERPAAFCAPWQKAQATDALSGEGFSAENGMLALTVPPRTALLLA